jgi:2-C-methyl-D-erythritol 4-phosphate cytidylyltransferase
MRASIPKQFLSLCGKPVALYSFDLLRSLEIIDELIVVCEAKYYPLFPGARFAPPGARRQDSVKNGLQALSARTDLVCIHDSARPFVTRESCLNLIAAGLAVGAAALAVPVVNTIKEADSLGYVKRTLDRATLWELHTPQIALLHLLQRGFSLADAQGLTVTDDAALVELTGHPVKLVQDAHSNCKLTVPEDWEAAERLLAHAHL